MKLPYAVSLGRVSGVHCGIAPHATRPEGGNGGEEEKMLSFVDGAALPTAQSPLFA